MVAAFLQRLVSKRRLGRLDRMVALGLGAARLGIPHNSDTAHTIPDTHVRSADIEAPDFVAALVARMLW